jgi:glycosyltransferase involved in cell wall biosynthesis
VAGEAARSGEPTGDPDRLRLSVDVTAVPSRPVGAGQYTLELVRELGDRPEVDLVAVARRGDGPRWAATAPVSQVVAEAPEPRPLRLAWEQVGLPRLLRRESVDVHHAPHYTMPEYSRVPCVVTVHDLSFFEAPEWHQRSKVLLFRRAIKVAARRAAVVVCPSQSTADELHRWCRVSAPVMVARHGVDLDRFAPTEPWPGADAVRLAGVDERLVDGSPFVVFVGTLEPRKDVPTLVSAFAAVADRHPEARLVLAGGAGWGAAQVEAAVTASGIGDRILRTGYLPDEVIPALLRTSTAVAYPALYEGFGLPALEALACGARLITTSGSAMEEVAGDAALLVPPGDVGALADALEAVLGGAGLDDDRLRRGLAIASRHTWAASADRHLEAFRLAAHR